MSRMHPGTSDRVVELMIVTQLKGLGGRRNNNAGRLQPKRRRRRRNTENYDDDFYPTARLRLEIKLALNTVQPPFFIDGFFRRLLLLFRSSATFRLYYSIQTTTTIPTLTALSCCLIGLAVLYIAIEPRESVCIASTDTVALVYVYLTLKEQRGSLHVYIATWHCKLKFN